MAKPVGTAVDEMSGLMESMTKEYTRLLERGQNPENWFLGFSAAMAMVSGHLSAIETIEKGSSDD